MEDLATWRLPLTFHPLISNWWNIHTDPQSLQDVQKTWHCSSMLSIKTTWWILYPTIHAKTLTWILLKPGAVGFKACNEEGMENMRKHRKSVSHFNPLKRGSSLEAWKYGEMRAFGSRLPQGGRRGDAYAMYAGINADSDEEIKALFEHAQVQVSLPYMSCLITTMDGFRSLIHWWPWGQLSAS